MLHSTGREAGTRGYAKESDSSVIAIVPSKVVQNYKVKMERLFGSGS